MHRIFAASFLLAATAANAGTMEINPVQLVEWKPVYGRIEAKDLVPARARISGTVTELLVAEGESVTQGQTIAIVLDEKLAYQVAALDAQLGALKSQLERAEGELTRGQALVNKGVVTAQRLDQLRTDVEVTRNQITAAEAQKSTVQQQQSEGKVLAPLSGRVLTTPVTRGGVVMGGEPIATVAGGGFFLRLAVPERHASSLTEGASIKVTTPVGLKTGQLAKIYPQIENGRVIADVEVADIDTRFVDARVLVELPVGERTALLAPADAVENRFGIDFIKVQSAEGASERAVVVGDAVVHEGKPMIEIVSGLTAGDLVVTP